MKEDVSLLERVYVSQASNPVNFFSPSELLMPFIEGYWIGEGKYLDSYIVEPDGVTDVVIVTDRKNQVISFGTTTQYSISRLSPTARYFGIRFKYGQFRNFYRVNHSEIINTSTELEGRFFGELNMLGSIENVHELVQEANHVLSRHLIEPKLQHQKFEKFVSLVSSNYMVNLELAINDSFTTKRTMQRWFKENVGVSPKKFQLICRAQAVKKFIESDPNISNKELCFRMNFTDESHLIRDFKSHFGLTPSRYRKLIHEQFVVIVDDN